MGKVSFHYHKITILDIVLVVVVGHLTVVIDIIRVVVEITRGVERILSIAIGGTSHTNTTAGGHVVNDGIHHNANVDYRGHVQILSKCKRG